MSNMALNPETWDTELDENGQIRRVSGPDFLVQHLKQRLQFYKGEWFLNITEGVPWFQDILGKGSTRAIIEARLKDVILRTDDVEELLEFSVTLDEENRVIKDINFTVLYGDEEVEVIL